MTVPLKFEEFTCMKMNQPRPSMGHHHPHEDSAGHQHDHDEEAANLFSALFGGNADAGSRITLLGLGANISLSVVKFFAGL